jgi:DNA-binding transcriptional MerR regulator
MKISGAIQVGQAAKSTAMSVDCIRFYERQKLLPAPTRTEGRLVYTLLLTLTACVSFSKCKDP